VRAPAASAEAVRSAVSLGVPRVLARLASYAVTQPGHNLCLDAQPAPSARAARAAYATVVEGIACSGVQPPPLDHPFDIVPLLKGAQSGEWLDAAALQHIGYATNALAQLSSWSEDVDARALAPTLAKMASCAAPPPRLRTQLCGAFELDERTRPAPSSTSSAERDRSPQPLLSSSFFPLLGKRRAAAAAAQRRFEDAYAAFLRTEAVKATKAGRKGGAAPVPIRREGTLVVPVKVGEAKARGEIVSVSRSGATAFVVPHELRALSAEAQAAALAVASAERRYLTALAHLTVAHAPEIISGVLAAAEIDAVLARARLGESWGGVVPVVGEEGAVMLLGARHPILCIEHSGAEFVTPNDVTFGFDFVDPTLAQLELVDAASSGLSPRGPAVGSSSIDVSKITAGGDASPIGGTASRCRAPLAAPLAYVQGLVLTGPNGGGKTVVLSTVGLAAWLARLAVPIPCARGRQARVDFFENIISDLGDSQSIADGLSSYAAHVRTCVHALQVTSLQRGETNSYDSQSNESVSLASNQGEVESATRGESIQPTPAAVSCLHDSAEPSHRNSESARSRSLVLLDEPGRGTDSDEGAAVAAAVIEDLLASGARVLATTHAPLLKRFALCEPRLGVAAMGREMDTGAPTYKLLSRVLGDSHALDAAARGGMPTGVISRARELMPIGEASHLAEMQKYVRALRDAAEEADAVRREVEALRAKAVAERAAAAAAAAQELSRASGWLASQQRRLDNQLATILKKQRRARDGVSSTSLGDGAYEVVGATVAALTISRRSADAARERALEMLGLKPVFADTLLKAGDTVVVVVSDDGQLTEDGIVARDAPPGSASVSVSMYGADCDMPREDLALWATVSAIE